MAALGTTCNRYSHINASGGCFGQRETCRSTPGADDPKRRAQGEERPGYVSPGQGAEQGYRQGNRSSWLEPRILRDVLSFELYDPLPRRVQLAGDRGSTLPNGGKSQRTTIDQQL